MEMNVVGRRSMHFSFRLGQNMENLHRQLFHRLIHRGSHDHILNIPIRAVGLMFFFNLHIESFAVNSVFDSFSCHDLIMLQRQLFHLTAQIGFVRSQIQQRRYRHISADSGASFQIQYFFSHFQPLLSGCAIRFIWAAR